jgi:hypothetical protein
VTLWIIVGVIALGALGLVCNWVLRARGGLYVSDALYPSDPDQTADLEFEMHRAQLNEHYSTY